MTDVRPWVEIADELRREITAGRWETGARLPSGTDLMARFGVARQTVQNAIDQLRAEGLISSVIGRGWFIAETRPVIRLARNRLTRAERDAGRGGFMSDAATAGFTPNVEVAVSRQHAGDDVAGWLNVEPGTEVVVRDRVMAADDEVLQLATSYLTADIAGGTRLEQIDTGAGGSYARLEELGHTLTHFEEMVSARPPRPEEAMKLQIPYGLPLIQITRIAYSDTRAVEVCVTVMSSQRYQLVYQIEAQ